MNWLSTKALKHSLTQIEKSWVTDDYRISIYRMTGFEHWSLYIIDPDEAAQIGVEQNSFAVENFKTRKDAYNAAQIVFQSAGLPAISSKYRAEQREWRINKSPIALWGKAGEWKIQTLNIDVDGLNDKEQDCIYQAQSIETKSYRALHKGYIKGRTQKEMLVWLLQQVKQLQEGDLLTHYFVKTKEPKRFAISYDYE